MRHVFVTGTMEGVVRAAQDFTTGPGAAQLVGQARVMGNSLPTWLKHYAHRLPDMAIAEAISSIDVWRSSALSRALVLARAPVDGEEEEEEGGEWVEEVGGTGSDAEWDEEDGGGKGVDEGGTEVEDEEAEQETDWGDMGEEAEAEEEEGGDEEEEAEAEEEEGGDEEEQAGEETDEEEPGDELEGDQAAQLVEAAVRRLQCVAQAAAVAAAAAGSLASVGPPRAAIARLAPVPAVAEVVAAGTPSTAAAAAAAAGSLASVGPPRAAIARLAPVPAVAEVVAAGTPSTAAVAVAAAAAGPLASVGLPPATVTRLAPVMAAAAAAAAAEALDMAGAATDAAGQRRSSGSDREESEDWFEVDGSQESSYEDAVSGEGEAVVLGKRSADELGGQADGPRGKASRVDRGSWASGLASWFRTGRPRG